MILVLFGPPGAGKGTQSLLMAKTFNVEHVSTGDLLRKAIKTQSEVGKKAKKFVDEGALVPDSIMLALIEELVLKGAVSGFLLDGFPRNVDQAEALDAMLDRVGKKVDKAVFLEVSNNLLKERLTGRRVCAKCGSTFHISLKVPKNEGVCDNCQGALEQRKDDKAEVIDNRLEVYEKNTVPLKKYYQDKKKFVSVDGVGDPGVVFDRIRTVVKNA